MVDLTIMSVAKTIQWQMVQWLVSNEFEGMLTKPAMAGHLLQHSHLSDVSDCEKSKKEVKVHIGL